MGRNWSCKSLCKALVVPNIVGIQTAVFVQILGMVLPFGVSEYLARMEACLLFVGHHVSA